jgi:uncharacterized protein (DUF1330 family)
MKNSEVYYLVSIFVYQGQIETLRQYEQAAVQVMAQHGGRFLHVFWPLHPGENEATPDEIHLLTFPSEDAFAAFRADPELQPYHPLRDQAVRHATFLKLVNVPLDSYINEPI